MYEVIVLGATFAAAGIAGQHKEKCLVIERRAQAGYEFFGALHFGYNNSGKIHEEAALSLQRKFAEEKSFLCCDSLIYPFFQECHTIFAAQLVSVQKIDEGFLCTVHGASGYTRYIGKKVIDTRCNSEISSYKTYNILMESDTEPAFPHTTYEKISDKNRYVLFCPVPLSCNYSEARSIAFDVIKQFGQNQRVIILANEFDYYVKGEYPRKNGEILIFPSKFYGSPLLAFQSGECLGKEL